LWHSPAGTGTRVNPSAECRVSPPAAAHAALGRRHRQKDADQSTLRSGGYFYSYIFFVCFALAFGRAAVVRRHTGATKKKTKHDRPAGHAQKRRAFQTLLPLLQDTFMKKRGWIAALTNANKYTCAFFFLRIYARN
jgi:hypothetical protein